MDDVLFKVVNRYKGCVYDVVFFDMVAHKVRLRRPDGSMFEVNMTEYRCYYRVVNRH